MLTFKENFTQKIAHQHASKDLSKNKLLNELNNLKYLKSDYCNALTLLH